MPMTHMTALWEIINCYDATDGGSMKDKKHYFLEFFKHHKTIQENEALIHKAGLEIANFTDDYYQLSTAMMKCAFTEEQVEYIEWWLYENVEKCVWLDKGKKRVSVETPEQLWTFITSKNVK